MVLGESNFEFRFRSIILFLPLLSMDEKQETEPKSALAKYDRSIVFSTRKQRLTLIFNLFGRICSVCS